eukprot:jgi/Hompol1/312/HPOL_005279-RA
MQLQLLSLLATIGASLTATVAQPPSGIADAAVIGVPVNSNVSPVHLGLQKRLDASLRQACFVSWRTAHPNGVDGTNGTATATAEATGTAAPTGTGAAKPPAKTPATPPPPQGATPFGLACLQAHNQIRARYGRAPFSYSIPAQQAAAWWATVPYSSRNPHNGLGFGQNVLSGAHNDGCATAMGYWFNSEIGGAINGRTIGQILERAGHLTQVLDRHSMQVGCAESVKTVCNYWPPGNFMNEVWHW